MEGKSMKTDSNTNEQFESTYALIVRSEEKQRSRLEMMLYTMLVASCLFAVSQFGREAATIPSSLVRHATITTAVQHS
jgi:cell division protein FtsL